MTVVTINRNFLSRGALQDHVNLYKFALIDNFLHYFSYRQYMQEKLFVKLFTADYFLGWFPESMTVSGYVTR
jgi:hypothetical protein